MHWFANSESLLYIHKPYISIVFQELRFGLVREATFSAFQNSGVEDGVEGGCTGDTAMSIVWYVMIPTCAIWECQKKRIKRIFSNRFLDHLVW